MNRAQAKVYSGLTKDQLEIIGCPGAAKHLEIVRKYADGEVVEGKSKSSSSKAWKEILSPNFCVDYEYRIKKPMRTINGFEVPAQEAEIIIDRNTIYCIPDFVADNLYIYREGRYLPKEAVSRGIVFDNKEAAIANAKAMLGIDPYKEES